MKEHTEVIIIKDFPVHGVSKFLHNTLIDIRSSITKLEIIILSISVTDSEDVRLFLDYFSRSKVLKYMLLASFHRIMNDEEDNIRKEIDRLRMNSEVKSPEGSEVKT